MDELKTLDEELTTADLANKGASKQSNLPKQVNGREPETPNKTVAVSEFMPLFSDSEMG
jgi:hypothetical protein